MKAILLAALLAGCGQECDLTSSGGTCYRLGSAAWTVPEVDAAESQSVALYSSLVDVDPARLWRVLEGAVVDVVTEKFKCGSIWAMGCQDGMLLTVFDLGCPQRSPLAHEAAHLFDAALGRPTDYHHGHTLYGLRSPYREINAATMDKPCPEVAP